MKITKISSGQKRKESANGIFMQDYCFYLFRSPVIFNINGTENLCKGTTAIIYTSGKKQNFRSGSSNGLKYDMICFRLSAADKQYIADMDIPLDSPVSVYDDFIISSAIKSMKIHSDISEKRKHEFSELYMRIILIALEDANSEKTHNIIKYPMLYELRNSVYENPDCVYSVEMICRRLNISKTYFHRIYSETFGITFIQDVIESRLIYACELLESTDLSVSAIAEKCGYESDSYFMRQFRQHKGYTPTEYRRKKIYETEE